MSNYSEQNDTSELPEGMPLDYGGYPMLPFDEGDWCECCGRVQPVKNGKCAVCGNGYDECEEDVQEVMHQGLNARMERLYPYLIDSE